MAVSKVTSATCAPRSFTSNWPREKGPAFVGGAKEIVMQRGRLGGIPLPRTIPIRDGGIVSPPGFQVLPARSAHAEMADFVEELASLWPKGSLLETAAQSRPLRVACLERIDSPRHRDHPRKGRGSQASTPGGNVINPTYN